MVCILFRIAFRLICFCRWLTACIDNRCVYMKSTRREDRYNYLQAEAGIDSIVLAYGYVVNAFTTTGLRDVTPLTMAALIVTMIILSTFQFNMIALTSEFTTLLEISQYSMSSYQHNMQQLQLYLQVDVCLL